MPKARKKENRGLPERWRLYHGAYYYLVPKGQEAKWDGKKQFRLGKALHEAYAEWASRMQTLDDAKTIGDLLDRYANQVVPAKPATSRRRDAQFIKMLRAAMGTEPIASIKPQHVYQYIDVRSRKVKGPDGRVTGGPTTARHETALLSHAYTKAVEWGYIDRHPFINEVRLAAPPPRTRNIEDWEIVEALSLPPGSQRHDSTLEIQAYIRVRLLTGLRGTDIFRLREAHLKDDGIHVTISKTGKLVIIKWTPALREAIEMARDARKVDISPFIFCNKFGQGYMNEEIGAATAFHAKWANFMKRLLRETKITERFAEKDLRAAAGTSMDSAEAAQKLLTHSNIKITKRIYRRRPEVINPAR